VLDNRRREPMAAIRDHGHAEILSDPPLTPAPRFRDNAGRLDRRRIILSRRDLRR
jgi:hypothetical protein